MLARYYLVGMAFIALSMAAMMRRSSGAVAPMRSPHLAAPVVSAVGTDWFSRAKPFCNTLEVETFITGNPPAASLQGAGYGAACWALAGRIDRARALIEARPASERAGAAGIVFEIGHPTADAGDNRSAGPIMELVVEFWPNHYMALYHAGAAEAGLGQTDLARKNLTAFLGLYRTEDGWRSSAKSILGRLVER
ncbi:MAG: hypothetical protein ABI647_11200 [Gemmatimonadota bacterium]